MGSPLKVLLLLLLLTTADVTAVIMHYFANMEITAEVQDRHEVTKSCK